MNGYDVYCELFPYEKSFFIKLSVLHKEKQKINNIKFSVFQNGQRYSDRFSDITGTTGQLSATSLPGMQGGEGHQIIFLVDEGQYIGYGQKRKE